MRLVITVSRSLVPFVCWGSPKADDEIEPAAPKAALAAKPLVAVAGAVAAAAGVAAPLAAKPLPAEPAPLIPAAGVEPLPAGPAPLIPAAGVVVSPAIALPAAAMPPALKFPIWEPGMVDPPDGAFFLPPKEKKEKKEKKVKKVKGGY